MTSDQVAPEAGLLAPLAARIGWTEGQLYTVLLGMATAVLLGLFAVPPTLQEKALAGGPPDVAVDDTTDSVADGAPLDDPVEDADNTDEAMGGEGADQFELPPPQRLGNDGAPTGPAPPPASSPDDRPGPAAEPPPTGPGDEPPPPASPSPPAPPPESQEPLRVVYAGYASASGGTPFATLGVPEGTVPVAIRAGLPDKLAYLRLVGGDHELRLDVSSDPGATRLDQFAAIEACRVIPTDWEVGRGNVDVADAPEFDCSDAAEGERSDDGTYWTFQLAAFDQEARQNGIVLVPADGSVEFQVAFDVGSEATEASGQSAAAESTGRDDGDDPPTANAAGDAAVFSQEKILFG